MSVSVLLKSNIVSRHAWLAPRPSHISSSETKSQLAINTCHTLEQGTKSFGESAGFRGAFDEDNVEYLCSQALLKIAGMLDYVFVVPQS